MSFTTASSILRNGWLIQQQYAAGIMPLVIKMLKGEPVDFGLTKDISITPVCIQSGKSSKVYNVSIYTSLEQLPAGSIAVVNITGPVTKYGDICSYGSVDFAALFNRLAAAANITGVVANIDSPGGEASGTGMLADALFRLSQIKPAIALIDDGIAASAAMWIAAAASEIYVSRSTDAVGSIGVYTVLADWYSYYEAQGLKVRDVYAPQSIDKNSDFKNALKGDDSLLEKELSHLAAAFIAAVKQYRGNRLTGSGWDTGKMFFADDAINIGLIDGIKSFSQVIERVEQLVSLKQSNNPNDMAFEKTAAIAKADGFYVVDGGFLLEEVHLNNLEASILANEVLVQSLSTSLEASHAQLANANAQIATLTQTISLLSEGDAAVEKAAPPADTDSFTGTSSKKYGNTSFDGMLTKRP